MWPAFPSSDYYGPPSHPKTISRQRACPSPPWLGGGRGDLGWFPRSPCTVRRGRRPAMPLHPRHEYAAGLPRGLVVGTGSRLRSPGVQITALRVRCCPAHIHQVGTGSNVKEVQPLVHLRCAFPSLLAGPGSSGSADPSRLCQGCLPSSPALPGSDCPQLHRTAATDRRRSPFISARFHGASWRTPASWRTFSRRWISLPRASTWVLR
jgi:hypothetical protein